MVFLTNAHTQTKHHIRILSQVMWVLTGGNLEKQGFIWTEINGVSPILIRVSTLTWLLTFNV